MQTTRPIAPSAMLAALTLSALLHLPAAGDPVLHLAWDDCHLGAAAFDKTDACDSDVGLNKLVVSLVPNAVIPSVNGMQGFIDITFGLASLPDYWQLGGGGARSGKLQADPLIGSSNPPFSCAEPWSAAGNLSAGANFSPDAPGSRITFIVAISETMTLDPAVSSEYYMLALNILKGGTTGTTGCAVPACLTLQEIRLTRPAGTPGGDVWACPPGPNFVTWQTGAGITCPDNNSPSFVCARITPAKNSTWGMVKQMYR